MDKGTYTRRRVDFSKYAVAFFNPFLFAGASRAACGCGAAALATVTGILPERIAARNGRRHYADRFIRKVLSDQGFTIVPLNLCRVSAAKTRVGNSNVVILSQLFRRNEATWGIIFNSAYYHNFQVYNLEALSLLNRPVLTAYVLWHPKWRVFPFPANGRKKATKGRLRPSLTKPFSC